MNGIKSRLFVTLIAILAGTGLTASAADLPSGLTNTTYNIDIAGGPVTLTNNSALSGTVNFYSGFFVELLVVAGGGGGGYGELTGDGGGGGGAGGLIYTNAFPVVGGNAYTVAVGTGGNGATAAGGQTRGFNGGNSQFATFIAIGGGGGGSDGASSGGNGGSGGGSPGNGTGPNPPPGSGTPGQGNNGGTVTARGGSGGGGASAAGANSTSANGSAGGAGAIYSISGANAAYAGGGGGGGQFSNGIGGSGGNGGGGTGGNGGFQQFGPSPSVAGNGTANTGGGGGGAGSNNAISRDGGSGGSGVVIVRYAGAPVTTSGPTTDTNSVPGYTIEKFTNTVTAGSLTVPTNRIYAATLTGNLTGNASLVYSGTGKLILTGSNSYTGSTTVAAGTLALGGSGSLPTTTALSLSGSSAVFDISGLTNGGATVGSLAGVAGSSVTLGAKTLTAGGDNSSTAFAGVIGGTGGGLTKAGTGTLTLSGANTYTGATTINAGTLAVTATNAIPGALVLGGGTLRNAVLSTNVLNYGTGGAITLNGGNVIHKFTNGTDTLNVALDTTTATYLIVGGGGGGGAFRGGGGGAGGYMSNEGGTPLSLLGSSNYTVVVGNGGNGGAFRTVTSYDSGAKGGNSSFAGIVAEGGGGGALGLASHPSFANISGGVAGGNGGSGGGGSGWSPVGAGGTGSQGSNGGAGYSGGEPYNGGGGGGASAAGGTGAFAVGGNGRYSSITGVSTPYAGGGGSGNYSASGTAYATAGGVGGGGNGGFHNEGGTSAAPTAGSANTGGGGGGGGNPVTVAVGSGAAGGSGIVIVSYAAQFSPGTLTLTGAIDVASTSTLDDGGGLIQVQSAMSGTGGIIKAGAGTNLFLAANTYSGKTLVNAGTLKLGNNSALLNSALDTAGSGFVALDTGITTPTLGGLIGSQNLNAVITGGYSSMTSLTLNPTNGTVSYSGAIANGATPLALFKTGAGTQVLSGANTYTGMTTINNGKLVINGSVAGGLTVNPLGTLGGTGTIFGTTLVLGTHSPGNSPGLQTFNGGLTYSNNATVVWELTNNLNTASQRGIVFDGINVSNSLTFADATALNLVFTNGVSWADTFWDTSRVGTNGWLVYDVISGSTTGFGNLSIATTNWLDSASIAFNSARPGWGFILYQDGQDIWLNYNSLAAPEPSTLLLLVVGGLVAWRQRRQS